MSGAGSFSAARAAASSTSGRDFHAPLHGLRGIAVLYVVLSHLGNAGVFLLPLPHDAIGKVGVWIFFALSAFLLTTHLSRDLEGTAPAGPTILSYAVQRFFRIYPLFVVVLVLHRLLRHLSTPEVLQHLVLAQGWGELWAIPVEFQYYACMPLIALAARRFSRPRASLALLALLAAVVAWGWAQPAAVFSNGLNIVPKLAPFLLGSLLALWRLGPPTSARSLPRARVVFMCSVLVLLAATAIYRLMARNHLPEDNAAWLSLAIALATAGLIDSALDPRLAFSRWLATRPLVLIGEISFSIYLLHMFVIATLSMAHLPPTLQAWLALGLAVACAAVSYRLIEQPGIRLGRRLAQNLSRR
jgi:peptidoglycan/LPS O-acetylase OafA/YrhL